MQVTGEDIYETNLIIEGPQPAGTWFDFLTEQEITTLIVVSFQLRKKNPGCYHKIRHDNFIIDYTHTP